MVLSIKNYSHRYGRFEAIRSHNNGYHSCLIQDHAILHSYSFTWPFKDMFLDFSFCHKAHGNHGVNVHVPQVLHIHPLVFFPKKSYILFRHSVEPPLAGADGETDWRPDL